MHTLTRAVKTIRALAPVAAGTTDQQTSGIDTSGFEGVRFIVGFGAITSGAVTSVKLQQSSDDGSVDTYADIADTSVTVVDTYDSKLVILELLHPQERYIRAYIDLGTQNAVIDLVIAELFNPRSEPVTADTTVSIQEINQGKGAGTA